MLIRYATLDLPLGKFRYVIRCAHKSGMSAPCSVNNNNKIDSKVFLCAVTPKTAMKLLSLQGVPILSSKHREYIQRKKLAKAESG